MRTARAKGVSRRAALWRHALPNALTPILTIMGLQFANLIAGAIVVENVFVLPGLGRLMLQSISNRDTLVVENGVMLLAGDRDWPQLRRRHRLRRDRSEAEGLRRVTLPPISPARGLELVARRGARRRADRRRGLVARLDALSADRDRHSPQAGAAFGRSLVRDRRSRTRRRFADSGGRARSRFWSASSRSASASRFGVVLGLVAACAKGLVEDGIMKLSDFVFAFPALLLGDHADLDLRPRRRQRDRGDRRLQRAGLRQADARDRQRRSRPRICARRPRRRARADRHRRRSRAAQYRACADRAGDDPVRDRHSRRGRAFLSRPRRAAACKSRGAGCSRTRRTCSTTRRGSRSFRGLRSRSACSASTCSATACATRSIRN